MDDPLLNFQVGNTNYYFNINGLLKVLVQQLQPHGNC